MRVDGADRSRPTSQFEDGFQISLREGEIVSLTTDVELPEDAVYWHLELDVLVGSSKRTIVVDDQGSDFFSPGRRADDEYREGHKAGVSTTDWGVLPSPLISSDGGSRMAVPGASVPALPDVDVYRPSGESESGTNSDLLLRREGRTLLTFNAPGAPADPAPAVGDGCVGVDDKVREGTDSGEVTAIVPTSSSTSLRANQAVDSRDYTIWCNSWPIFVRSLFVPSTGQTFVNRSTETAPRDVQYVDRLLAELVPNPPAGPPPR